MPCSCAQKELKTKLTVRNPDKEEQSTKTNNAKSKIKATQRFRTESHFGTVAEGGLQRIIREKTH